MMPYTKYLFQNKLQLTNCLLICLKFNKNFKITLFSMRNRRKTENKTGRCTADLKSNAPRLVLFCFVKKQCQTQSIGFLNPTCSGIRPGSCPPSRLLLARGVQGARLFQFLFLFFHQDLFTISSSAKLSKASLFLWINFKRQISFPRFPLGVLAFTIQCPRLVLFLCKTKQYQVIGF